MSIHIHTTADTESRKWLSVSVCVCVFCQCPDPITHAGACWSIHSNTHIQKRSAHGERPCVCVRVCCVLEQNEHVRQVMQLLRGGNRGFRPFRVSAVSG